MQNFSAGSVGKPTEPTWNILLKRSLVKTKKVFKRGKIAKIRRFQEKSIQFPVIVGTGEAFKLGLMDLPENIRFFFPGTLFKIDFAALDIQHNRPYVGHFVFKREIPQTIGGFSEVIDPFLKLFAVLGFLFDG